MAIIHKHITLVCFAASILFMVIAAQYYPGGSILVPNAKGFGFSSNYLSNLFEPKALNGLANPARIWAMVGMVFHAIGFGLFFVNMAKNVPLKNWASVIKWIGYLNFLFIVLIATPLHDIGVISIVFTLIGLFVLTMFIFKSKLHWLKALGICCLATFYGFFISYGFSFFPLAFIMQKIYVFSAMLLATCFTYFTRAEDFIVFKNKSQN